MVSVMTSLLSTILFTGGLAALPLGIPPAAADPAMARVAPEECLLYVSWSGMAEASADSLNHTERLLAEPEVKHFIKEVVKTLNTALKQGAGQGENARRIARIAPQLISELAVNPVVIFAGQFSVGPTGPTVPVGLVVKTGDRSGSFEQDLLAMLEILTEQPVPPAVKGMRTVVTPPGVPPIQWTIADGYFILGIGHDTISRIQDRMNGSSVPAWLTRVHQRLPVDRVASVSYLNTADILTAAAPVLAPFLAPFLNQNDQSESNPLDTLGLTQLKTVVNVTGLSQTSTVSRTWLELEGPPRGLFALLDSEPLQASDLAVIPADATIAATWKLNPTDTFNRIVALINGLDPGSEREILDGLREIQGEIGFDLKEDLIGSLGDTWTLYTSPSEHGPIGLNATAVLEVRDTDRLQAVSRTIASQIRHVSELAMNRAGRRPRTVGLKSLDTHGHTVHFLNAIGEDMPVAPAWCVTDRHLILSLFPQGIQAFLNRRPGVRTLASQPHIAKRLQADSPPATLLHVDSRTLCRTGYPLILIGANLLFSELQREGIDINISVIPGSESIARHLLPALTTVTNHADGLEIVSTRTLPVSLGASTTGLPLSFLFGISSQSRMTRFGQPDSSGLIDILSPARARQTGSSNNLKQLGLAMHNFHDTHRAFPAASTKNSDGQSLLSWRVQLLPFLEEFALFNEFHHDEPWDSPHNKSLIPRMPRSLQTPGSQAGKGKTNYVALLHENGIFDGGAGRQMRSITDGTSNTLMLAEVDDGHAVIWTRPDDLNFNPKKPRTGLFGLRKGGFLAAFCDGAVHFIPETILDGTLVRLVQRNDGQNIDFGQFRNTGARNTIRAVRTDEQASPPARPTPPAIRKPVRRQIPQPRP